MKVFVQFFDSDNSCSDPECCGGPFPSYTARVFSSVEKAKAIGVHEDCLTEIEVDNADFQYVNL